MQCNITVANYSCLTNIRKSTCKIYFICSYSSLASNERLTLSPFAVNMLSSSDCLDHSPQDFSFRRHISYFSQLHSSNFMYLIHPFSPWSSSSPPSISVCQHHSFFQSILSHNISKKSYQI